MSVSRRRTAALASTAGLAVAITAIAIAVTSAGDEPAARHHSGPAAAAAPVQRVATPRPLTATTLRAALTKAVRAPVSMTAVSTRGGATVSKDVIVSGPDGSTSDAYYDRGVQLTTKSGTTATGTVILIDYTAKQWYTPAGASMPTSDFNWINNGLATGAFTLTGNQITGKDQVGSPVTITLDPDTALPTTVVTDEPSGVVTQTYTWGTTATASAAAQMARQAVVTAPAGFAHLAHAPNTITPRGANG